MEDRVDVSIPIGDPITSATDLAESLLPIFLDISKHYTEAVDKTLFWTTLMQIFDCITEIQIGSDGYKYAKLMTKGFAKYRKEKQSSETKH